MKPGGYVLCDAENLDVTLIASGSEVSLVLESAEALNREGVRARGVPMPCMEVFRKRSAEYRTC